jgi:hypothetical protein
MSRDDQIQQFIDAIADPQVFCDGRLVDLYWSESSGSMEPNCQQRHQCRLFRSMPSRNARQWHGQGTAEHGCLAYQLAEQDKTRQSEDSREWIVTMAGQTKMVTGRDPQAAAIRMFLILRDEGFSLDKMLLVDRRYVVRET